jgi:protein gp37
MGDIFHKDAPHNAIVAVWHTMAWATRHTFLVLTKRPQRAGEFLRDLHRTWGPSATLTNVWVGISVENQAALDERLPWLLKIPAAVRWVSYEPALGPIAFPPEALKAIGWVVCGFETGPGARPGHPQWARDMRDECIEACVPFWFKAWGAWRPGIESDNPLICSGDDTFIRTIGIDGRLGTAENPPYCVCTHERSFPILDGRYWNELPEVPR